MIDDDIKIELIINSDSEKTPVFIINCDDKNNLLQIDNILRTNNLNNYALAGLYNFDWNRNLSPWPAEAVFRNNTFTGEADEYLRYIEDKIIPYINNRINTEYYCITGYSLAGLFSLYCGFNSDKFSRIISCSGSLWYESFTDYVRNNELKNIDYIYLSLGDKEYQSKNALMTTVQDKHEEVYDLLKDKTDIFYELNEGNHFKDPEERIVKGIRYMLAR